MYVNSLFGHMTGNGLPQISPDLNNPEFSNFPFQYDSSRKLHRTCCVVYLDDILIFSQTFGDHLEDVEEALKVLQSRQLSVKRSKVEWGHQVQFLGYVLGSDGLSPDPSKVASIVQWPAPKTVSEVKSFLGLVGWYRRHIRNKTSIPTH